MFARASIVVLLLGSLLGGIIYERSLVYNGTMVSFLSVGQGDCTVFMSEGWTMLVDAGPKTRTFDGGERLVLPELRKLGVRKIDCLVLTHPDADHVGGLEAIASRYRIGTVVVSSAFKKDTMLRTLFRKSGIDDSQIVWIDEEARTTLGLVAFRISAPPIHEGVDDNDLSLFVRADIGHQSIALTGDASIATEDVMTQRSDWNVDLLKAGHHGSATSTGDSWLGVTTPEIVIASCGRRNYYNHPSPEVVDRVSKAGAKFYRTDHDGTVTFVLQNDGIVLANR